MVRKFGAKQLTEIEHNGLRILISYQTPVAVFTGSTLVRTERKFSVTTSKHITFYINTLIKEGHTFSVVTAPQHVIENASVVSLSIAIRD
jgi:kynurenine formamidase